MEEKNYALGFSLIPNIGLAAVKKLKKKFKTLEKAWHGKNAGDFVFADLKTRSAEAISSGKNKINLENELALLQKEELNFISFWDKEYPEQLRQTSCAPLILYYRGNISLLKEKQLAIVGSRKLTNYGQQAIEKIVPDIVYAGLAITSGLAMGADSYAHQITLENNGQAIAVMGNGLSWKITRGSFSYNLLKEILSNNGLVLSEFPPFFEANKFTFPARNRVISGLSLGTLIVEAAEKSGSLITANYALEQNREVFAIPGNIFSPESAGTNKLIKEGAKCVTSSNDILEALNFISNFSDSKKDFIFEDKDEEKIYKLLSFEPILIDSLIKKTGMNSGMLSAKLSLMELKGMAKTISGGKVIKN